MRRGRRSLTPEEKQQRKDSKNADKAQALADNALAKLPADKDRRNELWRELDALRSEGHGVSGQISQHKKRMHEVFGVTKSAMQIRAILAKCKDGEYEATVQQVQLFLDDMGRPIQLSMNLEPGKGVAEDSGSVFDKSTSGERHDAERGDDPGRARRRSVPSGPPPAPSPAMPLDEAEAAFTANVHKLNRRSADPLPGADGVGSYKIQ